ncbi:pyridoxal phosphate-dependent aminotransferase [Oceanobacillus arenosus]|uniref:Pyridoxal phosphate-dependent aminotransferase n=1 Tax=Oceanobacillus arenosus TaxID=1229153 RepID=A0A3D8Q4H3_9BACI|nr:aminotransferase class I/II-fold pyridoxal phosphate-dependent enzyme [Oceanobacillus arenosus]RDW22405.1 pyridoxal phosphate-dependent aminotransferase [Oceanobacillus arenosus]
MIPLSRSMIYLSPPHMTGEEQQYLNEAFASNWIAPVGPNVDAFEQEIAELVGVNGALAVSSGTSAIHLALSLLDIKKGDTVFCSTLTFVASANPILYQGAEPVFIDSDPDSWNMSPKALMKAFQESALKRKLPKAVMVVNLYGQSAKMDEILLICDQYGVPLIEDAAESLGTTYQGKASGSFGKFGIYSFNGNKIITTSGGGMLVSNDEAALERARFLASQARDQATHYQHSVMGYNYRLSNLLAGVGRGQLRVLGDRVAARRKIFDVYYSNLSDLPGIHFMSELENTAMNRWLTTLTIDEKVSGVTTEQLLTAFYRERIEARPVWKPLHLQPLFKGARFYAHERSHDVAEELFRTGICLPSGSSLTEEEQLRVIQCVRKVFDQPIRNRSYLFPGKQEV